MLLICHLTSRRRTTQGTPSSPSSSSASGHNSLAFQIDKSGSVTVGTNNNNHPHANNNNKSGHRRTPPDSPDITGQQQQQSIQQGPWPRHHQVPPDTNHRQVSLSPSSRLIIIASFIVVRHHRISLPIRIVTSSSSPIHPHLSSTSPIHAHPPIIRRSPSRSHSCHHPYRHPHLIDIIAPSSPFTHHRHNRTPSPSPAARRSSP